MLKAVSKTKSMMRPAVVAAAIVGAFLLFLVAGTALILINAYRSTDDIARVRVTSNAEVVAANFEWLGQTSRQLLQRLDDYVGPNFEVLPANAKGFMKDALSSIPGSPRLYLVKADGTTELTTDPDFKPIDIRDRDYFKAVATGEPAYISPMIISRLTGEPIFVFSKRIERNGKFVGAAIVSFNTSLMQNVWASLHLDPTSSVVVTRDDGMVVTRYPSIKNRPDISGSDLFTKYLPEARIGSYETVSTVDGVRRIVAYQRLENTHLVAVATIGQHLAFAPFYKFAALCLSIAIPIALFLAYLLWAAYRWFEREAQQRSALEMALETNKMMFREIHHRVKNNLQAVNSLLNLQKIDAVAKRDMSQRILAMVAVHEQIYQNDQFGDVDASAYIPSIINKVVQSYGSNVDVTYDLEEIDVDREHALPLGLITNEVVSNSLKHGFRNGAQAKLNVSFKKLDGGRVGELKMRDNGVGFDPLKTEKGMGTKLLNGMVAQLQGEFKIYNDGGSVFELRWPLSQETKAHFEVQPLPNVRNY